MSGNDKRLVQMSARCAICRARSRRPGICGRASRREIAAPALRQPRRARRPHTAARYLAAAAVIVALAVGVWIGRAVLPRCQVHGRAGARLTAEQPTGR